MLIILPALFTISIDEVVILILPTFIPSSSPTNVATTAPALTNFREAVCKNKSLKGLFTVPISNVAASLGTI